MRWIGSAALCVAACGRLEFDPRIDAARNGGIDAPADTPPCAFGPWQTPQPITELNTATDDLGGQITPDGLALYFDNGLGAVRGIWVARRASRVDPFGPARRLTELDMSNVISDPSTTGDELELYFDTASGPGPCIWRATRANITDPFGSLTRLDALCSGNVAGANISSDGLTLYYNSQIGGPEGELYVTTRASRADSFSPGIKVPVLAGGAAKGYAAASADRLTLYYETGVTVELWQVTRADRGAAFENPMMVPGVDTGSGDEDASITADGTELFFSSSRANGIADLYVAKRSCL
ncbi:MAG: hypothetical protein JWO36_3114 [Myxococcales bacterium]|nr:hypothetical protein [Myxococcales bacterium]